MGINVPNGLSKTVLHIFRKCETQSGRTGKSHFIFQLYSRKNYGAYDNHFNRLNIPLATHQTLGPTTCLEFLGIILDKEKLEARLPQDKVNRICEFIKIILHKYSCTKRELLQLLGHMNFATSVIIPGRSFVSYLIELSTSVTVKELHYYVHLNKECRVDLQFYPFLKVGMVSTCL